MRRPFGFVILFACGSLLSACRGGTDGPSVDVFALAGEVQPEPGASVLMTTIDGVMLDQQTTDGSGHAFLAYTAGALVTVEYIRNGQIQLITTPTLAPTAGTLAIHGPLPDKAPILAGSLVITAVAIEADAFEIDLGCTKITTPAFPKTVDILATCFGSDSKVDVLVRALSNGTVVGYDAARVQVINEIGMLDIPQWTTDFTAVPVTQNDRGAMFAIDEVADGLVFAAPDGTDLFVPLWTGLTSEETLVRATVANTTTTQFVAGVPTAIAFGAGDFLPATTTHLTRAQDVFAWTAFGVGDLTSLHTAWASITWDTVLPPDASTIRFPDPTYAPPIDAVSTLRAIDAPATNSFDDVQAGGLWIQGATDATLVAPVTSGEVRETNAL